AIVSEAMAAGLWPGADPIGRSMTAGKDARRLQVIGVAATVTQHYVGEPPRWYLYRPLHTPEFGERMTMVIRTTGDPRRLMGAVQEQVQALDPALPIATLKTMAQRMEMPLWPARTAAGFFLVCGALALVLATVGLFGVTYFLVNQRRREFGVRVALGATSYNVMRLVIRDGLSLSLPGVALGIAAALVVMRFAERALFGVSAVDPLAYASTAGIQLLVALAACAVPARRATRVDPMVALRVD
ncbi:MAG: FtsX-like permease family protein, partial [Vicinamibacterales bacterium]